MNEIKYYISKKVIISRKKITENIYTIYKYTLMYTTVYNIEHKID